MSDNKLKEIINDDSYDVLAKEVAKEILCSDRTEYYQQQEKIYQTKQRHEENIQVKLSAQQTHPLYDDIHQIAKDFRFFRNLAIASIIISILTTILYIVFINNLLN